jgi:hypothetical protein
VAAGYVAYCVIVGTRVITKRVLIVSKNTNNENKRRSNMLIRLLYLLALFLVSGTVGAAGVALGLPLLALSSLTLAAGCMIAMLVMSH